MTQAPHTLELKCPNCGQFMHDIKAANALSRFDNFYICSACGSREASEGVERFWAGIPRYGEYINRIVAEQKNWPSVGVHDNG